MKYYFENDGYCVCCDKNVKFNSDKIYSYK